MFPFYTYFQGEPLTMYWSCINHSYWIKFCISYHPDCSFIWLVCSKTQWFTINDRFFIVLWQYNFYSSNKRPIIFLTNNPDFSGDSDVLKPIFDQIPFFGKYSKSVFVTCVFDDFVKNICLHFHACNYGFSICRRITS